MILLTPGELARRVGVTPDTVRHWERTGQVEAFKTETGRRLFTEQTVALILARQQKRDRKDMSSDGAATRRPGPWPPARSSPTRPGPTSRGQTPRASP